MLVHTQRRILIFFTLPKGSIESAVRIRILRVITEPIKFKYWDATAPGIPKVK